MYKFVLSPHAFIIYSAALSGRHKCQALGEISCWKQFSSALTLSSQDILLACTAMIENAS